MPNDDACIIGCSAETSQAGVLIANGDVPFLDDNGSYDNTESSSVVWVKQLK